MEPANPNQPLNSNPAPAVQTPPAASQAPDPAATVVNTTPPQEPKHSRFSKKLILILLILVVVIVLAAAGGYSVLNQSKAPAVTTSPTPTTPVEEGVVCTQDAKECPDGSFVGREGPNCEFAACPGENASSSADTSGWKTYSGPNKAYSISYPGDWKIYNPGAKSGGIDEADFISPDQSSQGYFIVQSWFENGGTTPTGSSLKALSNGYKYSIIRSGPLEPRIPENVYSQTAYIYNPNGGYLYLVVNTPESEKDLLEQIASTVKFN
jgi:hypothetical protein